MHINGNAAPNRIGKYQRIVRAAHTGNVRRGITYDRFGLPGFDGCEPQLTAYVATLQGYERNQFPPLAPALRERVAREWHRSFERWGYRA